MKLAILIILLTLCSVLLTAQSITYTVYVTNYQNFPSGEMFAVGMPGYQPLDHGNMKPVAGSPGWYQCTLHAVPNPLMYVRVTAKIPGNVANGWWGNSTRDFNENSTEFSLPSITLRDSSNPPIPK